MLIISYIYERTPFPVSAHSIRGGVFFFKCFGPFCHCQSHASMLAYNRKTLQSFLSLNISKYFNGKCFTFYDWFCLHSREKSLLKRHIVAFDFPRFLNRFWHWHATFNKFHYTLKSAFSNRNFRLLYLVSRTWIASTYSLFGLFAFIYSHVGIS